MRLAQEKKAKAEEDKTNWKGYWARLRREWKDKISEESMARLKTASKRLSTYINDYMGLVKEIPSGTVVVVNQAVAAAPAKAETLPEITF